MFTGPVSGTKINSNHSQRNIKKEGNPIAKKQEVFVPSPREWYDDYERRYDYPDLDREPIPIRRQTPLSSSIIFRNDEQPREEHIPRRMFGYDGGESNNQFLDAQDYENTFGRNGNFMFEDQEKQRTGLEGIPSRIPFEHAAKYQEELRPFEELQGTRVSPASPIPTSQDMSYAGFLRTQPVVHGYPRADRISSQDEPVLWQQEAINLRAKAEALKAKKYLKHLIEEVGPTVTLKQVLDKYGPKVASLFSELQYASGARFPNPINETKFTPKPAETKQRKQQKLLPQKHQEDGLNKMAGLTKTNRTKSNLKILELASEVTKEAEDFIKIFRWFNKYYRSFKRKPSTNVDDKGDNEDNIRKKKVRIEKITKHEHQEREGTRNYEKIENILNSL